MNHKYVLSAITMFSICWLFVTIVNFHDKAVVYTVNTYNDGEYIKFPVNGNSINVYGLEMDKKQFEMMVQIAVERVKTKNATEGRTKITANNSVKKKPKVNDMLIGIYGQDQNFELDWFQKQLLDIYNIEYPLIRRMINLYWEKSNDSNVRERVINFIEEMEND